MKAEIELTNDYPFEELKPLIAESEAAGLWFLSKLRDDWSSGANRFDRPGEGLFVSRVDGIATGICRLNRNPYDPSSRSGRVRRLYVANAFRRQGIGKALVSAVIDHARPHFTTLVLRTVNPEADAFYRAIGFDSVSEANNTHRLNLLGLSLKNNAG